MVSVPYVISDGVNYSLPNGFRLDPTDEQIVMLYLIRKVLSLPLLNLPETVMPEIPVRQFDPWNFPGGDEDVKFFFTREDPELTQEGIRMKRVSVTGVWRERSEDAILSLDRQNILATKRTYTYVCAPWQPTIQPQASWTMHQYSWTMHEYCLVETSTLEQHLQMIAAANNVPMQFTRYYACKIVRIRRR